jgi:hypothetical protein
MTDLDELFRPLIEDGARHREPVEAIEMRARARRSLRRGRRRTQYAFAASFVAVSLIAATVGIVNARDHGSSRAGPIVTTTPPATDSTPTAPAGWVSYDYGLARLSVPPDYTASRGTACPAAEGPVLELTPTGDTTDMTCLPGDPTVTLAPIREPAGFRPPGLASSVNGIDYVSVPSHCPPEPVPPSTVPPTAPVCEPSIWVPSLNVIISFAFTHRDNVAQIETIIDTLTYSTYARVLQQPFGPAPASWKTIALAGYVARVPASWAVVRDSIYCGPVANTASVASSAIMSECPPPGPLVAPPADAARFERYDTRPPATPSPGARVLHHNGLNFTQQPVSGGLENEIHFAIDAPHGPLDVTLALGLDPAVARGILGSLKMPGAP